MAFKMKGFPMQAGTSPMRQDKVDDGGTTSNTGHVVKTGVKEDKNETTTETPVVEEDKNLAGDFSGITAPTADQIDTDQKNAEENEEKAANGQFDGTGGEKGVTKETEDEAYKNAWRNTGGGHIYAAGESIVKGIKNMRAKRKARKAGELTDAQAAVTGGTANLKQTKLVDKTNDKTHKKLVKTEKDNIKDAEKLKQYNIDKQNKAAGISKRQAKKNKAKQDAASGELYKVGK
jgi:hypothetical protein